MLFWHNHLVTDTGIYRDIAILAYRYNRLLRSSCPGYFKKLMYDITVDSAMLRYLNGEKNTSIPRMKTMAVNYTGYFA